MNQDFVKLVNDEYEKFKTGEKDCFYIGEGNPDADILIIGNECASSDTETVVATRNVTAWKEFLDRKYSVEEIQRELPDYKEIPHNCYYPLFPWLGQKCIVCVRDKDGNAIRGENGTARTWVQYQKLTDWANGKIFNRNNPIDFHLHAFHTELSQIPEKHSGPKNKNTEESINTRLRNLFSQPFFKKFPVVIIAAGQYVPKYDIHIEQWFSVDFDGPTRHVNGDCRQWINLHHGHDNNTPRLLIHTRHFADSISDDCIKAIADLVKPYISRQH